MKKENGQYYKKYSPVQWPLITPKITVPGSAEYITQVVLSTT